MSPDSPLQSGVQALSVPPSLALLASRPPGQVLGNCRNSTGLGSSHAASATSRPWGPGPLGCRCDIRVLTLTHSCLVWLLRWLGPRSQPGEPRRWNLQMGRESERKLVPAS